MENKKHQCFLCQDKGFIVEPYREAIFDRLTSIVEKCYRCNKHGNIRFHNGFWQAWGFFSHVSFENGKAVNKLSIKESNKC